MIKTHMIFFTFLLLFGFATNVNAMVVDSLEAEQVVEFVCDDGWIYTGEMRDGQRHGNGMAITKKGNVYSGNWVYNQLPEGVLLTKGNDYESAYEGTFNSAFAPHGFGVMKYTKGKNEGDEYIGNFVNGSKQGIGKLIKKNGKIEFGRWKGGVLQTPKGQNFNPGDKAYGIDLSHHNPKINWDKLALYCNSKGDVYKLRTSKQTYLQPVSWVYLRATEGATVVDSLYQSYSFQATRHRIPKGSYHLLSFTSSSVEDQIANFLNVSGNCENDELPPMLDLESPQARAAGKEKVMSITLKWLKEVEKKTGRKPIIYTTDRFANKYLDMKKLKGYTIWKAAYGDNNQVKKAPEQPYDIWQFTHKGSISGIAPVDINVYEGSVKEFNHKFVNK